MSRGTLRGCETVFGEGEGEGEGGGGGVTRRAQGQGYNFPLSVLRQMEISSWTRLRLHFALLSRPRLRHSVRETNTQLHADREDQERKLVCEGGVICRC